MPPRELVVATRMSLDGLRPWEYWAMSAWDYDRVAVPQGALAAARERYATLGQHPSVPPPAVRAAMMAAAAQPDGEGA